MGGFFRHALLLYVASLAASEANSQIHFHNQGDAAAFGKPSDGLGSGRTAFVGALDENRVLEPVTRIPRAGAD